MTTNARDEKWSSWIDWSGGQCPLENGTEYTVKLRAGLPMDVEDKPEELDWRHSNGGADIIAYRYKIKEPESVEVTEAEEEAWQAKERELAWNNERQGRAIKKQLGELGAIAGGRHKYNAYFKDVRHIDTLDVYRVVSLFDCEKHGHPISHAAKKLLLSGSRTGGKDVESDVREAIDTLHRWLEMREEDARA